MHRMSEILRTCRACSAPKPLTEFYASQSRRDGISATCKGCTAKTAKRLRLANQEHYSAVSKATREQTRARDPLAFYSKQLLDGARNRSKKLNIPIEIDRDWVEARLRAGKCSITGLPFVLETPRHPHTPSIDQMIAGEGYTLANAQVVVWIYNAAKQTWGHETVLEFAQSLSRPMKIMLNR
jgi:hypothetical protein